ncbi:LuxR C-terminal-related transcriptional regulator [Streptomyces sp. NRRL F-5650]|jgi:transposase|uniref:LuxR C-terminal-related transcriptional regulator n=1 Tax=Streptomyces sp. NRRL F-5650 TaxID=1463868 RepID=UPI0018FE4837|nr:LuxR C-terminal-related transcriptional regulator [Streptomyces sp. NRRL F-5650]
MILNLLYAGFSDASIARRLGVGHRTVQRRVQRLMEQLRAKGRVALGARAQELGLLPPRASAVRTERVPAAADTLSQAVPNRPVRQR